MRLLATQTESQARLVADFARIIETGGVAIFPTDTVYGLAAHPDRPDAVQRLYRIKRRDLDKPLALLVADLEVVRANGAQFTPAATRWAERFWPGALTLVMRCGNGDEGFRVPRHPLARSLIKACGGLLRVTSANLYGKPPALDVESIRNDLGAKVDLAIDDGPSDGGVPSTVVRVQPNGWLVLRHGAVSANELRALAAEIGDPSARELTPA